MRLTLVWLTFGTVVQACTPVAGERIVGRDMAAEHAAFAGIDPEADLSPAPVTGLRRTFHYFELERLAKQHAVNLSSSTSREACFERSAVHLDPQMLASVLHISELEIVDFSRTALPGGKAEFRPAGLTASGLWQGRWLYGENRSVPIWVRVHVAGLRSPAGSPEIARGDRVRVEVHSGGVLLAFDASAENSGHVGERVTVRNPDNGQRFRAVVEAPGKVRIGK